MQHAIKSFKNISIENVYVVVLALSRKTCPLFLSPGVELSNLLQAFIIATRDELTWPIYILLNVWQGPNGNVMWILKKPATSFELNTLIKPLHKWLGQLIKMMGQSK